ncbi:hypothetical protein GCM10010530_84540 [Kribbella aluminosa]
MDYQPDAPERLRIAQVGAGMHAYRNILPLLTFLSGHHVWMEKPAAVTVADVDRVLAEQTFAPAGSETGAVVWESQESLSTFECRAEVTQGLCGGLAHFVACVLAGDDASAIVSNGDTVEIGDQS